MSGLAQLTTTRIKNLSEVKGYTERSRLPMQLMFNQPNNTQNFKLHLESVEGMASTWTEVLKERTNALDFVLKSTLNEIKNYFYVDGGVSYGITSVPYATLANVDLPNVIGLKCDIHTYAKKIEEALTLALNVLEFELPSLLKVVAQLVTDKNALTSLAPITSLTDVKMYTQDIDKTKNELAAMVGHEQTQSTVKFGSIYYSLNEWKECTKTVLTISTRLKKARLGQFNKDVKNLTVLMDKLILRSQNVHIPQANIETYAKVIEDTSNHIAFAGAVIHMAETLLTVLNQHNEILTLEINDYNKGKK